MRNKRLFSLLAVLTLVVSLAVAAPIAHGDGPDGFTPPEKQESQYPNLGSHLNQVVAAVEGGGFSPQLAAADSLLYSGESVAVTIYLTSNVADVVQFLEDNGGDPRNVGDDYIEAYVPVTLLGELSEQPGVTRVREIVPPQPDYGPISSQGVQTHLAQAWHDAQYTGQDVKVGVIDLGFLGLTSLMGSELPTNVRGMCYTDVGEFSNDLSDCDVLDEISPRTPPQCIEAAQRRASLNSVHGTAVAESLVDIAPQVSLYVANPFSRADLQDATRWMASEGVSVINYSVSSIFDGPGDGTSPFSDSPLKTVDEAVANDILWVNSAGNAADNTWFGDYSDPDGDGAISLDEENDEVIDLPFFECRGYTVQLRWEDSWEGASTDLDLHLYHKGLGAVVFSSDDAQSGRSDHIPWEELGFTALSDSEDYGLAATLHSGPVPDWIQLVVWGPGDIEHYTEYGSIGNPSESANPGLLSVGAAHYWDVNTTTLYSSRGPAPDGRVKPDIVGTDCAATVSYPERTPVSLGGNSCWFSGTSQASPHVAGLAALVLQRFPHFTPDQVADYLKHYAEPREAPDPYDADITDDVNNNWGHGFAVLPAPDTEPSPGFDTSCGHVITGNGAYNGQWAVGCQSSEPDRGHSRYYSFTLDQESEVTIDLESDDADPYLYLRQGNTRSGTVVEGGEDDDGGEGFNSQLVVTLEAGTYTIEATTYAEEETGSFTLSISGLGGIAGPPSDPCAQTLTSDGPVSSQWDSGCASETPAPGTSGSGDRLARFYTFDLTAESDVTITLEAADADAYLYLRRGNARSGTAVNDPTSDDDAGGGTSSQVVETLEAGTYTIEATTYEAGQAGSFTLSITGIGGTAETPIENCVQTIAPGGEVSGQWATGCHSETSAPGPTGSGTRLARFYNFALAADSEVTITLESVDADAYLYLRGGNARSGTALNDPAGDDDAGGGTNSEVVETLSAGAYTIEATTYNAGESGGFTLTIAVSSPSDRAALVAFYNATGGTNWGNSSAWLTDAPIGEWHGVTADGEGRVTSLLLSSNQLSGGIPAELSNLTNLITLSLHTNQLSGQIPAELGSLANLRNLSLDTNQLTGEIPAELGNLANLENLWLNSNQLTGQIPSELSNLTNLEALVLHSNQLSGGISDELGNLTNLAWLVLHTNQLSGEIPSELGNLTGLTWLVLSSNELSGQIPAELGDLTNLENLYLSNNQLTGEIPSTLGDLDNLTAIYLAGNELTGCVPEGLRDVSNSDLDQLGLDFCGP